MKKIVNGKILREKMNEAINLLCGTVKATLGPKGNNVIIDHSSFTPFITNDGVTIAENIESDDAVVNTILTLAKEASIKTNEVVGDGTTTTLVLLEAIYNYGIKLIDEGISPLTIKKELDLALLEILKMIDNFSKTASKDDLLLVATNSANSLEIGKNISEVFNKIKNKNSIFIKEGNLEKTIINYIKGYTFDTVLASPYFLQTSELLVNNPYILIKNEIIDDIELIAENLNYIINNNESLIILAKDYSDDVVNQILSLYLDENINIILLKNPEFGIREYYFESDIKAILDNQINGYKTVKGIKINKNKTTILFNKSQTLLNHVKHLKTLKFEEEIDSNYIKEKISMFQNGIAEIIVGSNTITERRELKMRYDDALCAVSSCDEGVVPGSGIIYALISDYLTNQTIGNDILKNALIKPLEQIIINSDLDNSILEKIKNSTYQELYNVKTENFENISDTKVIDPTKVIKNALKNSCSIASMLLTTNALVINEYSNNINKINDFNEI